jgi:hypothetical protein
MSWSKVGLEGCSGVVGLLGVSCSIGVFIGGIGTFRAGAGGVVMGTSWFHFFTT